jgi:concanavalin A-like lectin/glucanase superfamily protein
MRTLLAVASIVATLALGSSAAGATSPTVALWHLDETSGASASDAVGGHTGAIHNVTQGVPGFAGSAFRFDGKSSYVDVPSDPALNPGSAPIQFTVHIRYTVTPPNGSTTDYDILRKGTSSDSAQFYKVEIRPDNRAVCRFVGSKTSKSGILIHTGPTLNDGRWHTISCTKANTSISLVVDGKTFTKSGTVGSISNTGPLTLGAKPGKPFSDFYNGDLDEVSVSIG